MKIKLENLIRARELASHRIYLTAELDKLTSPGQLVVAVAKVRMKRFKACPSELEEVEIKENKDGPISQAIYECIRQNLTDRINDLDKQLKEFGIEIE